MVSLDPVQSESEQFVAESRLAAEGKGRLMHLGRSDEALLRDQIDRHLRFTASSVALRILDDWDTYRGKFVKVFPNEYKRALAEISLKAMTALGEIRATSEADDAIAKARTAGKAAKITAPK